MKKTNFVVVFWLVLALVSFGSMLIQLSNFWRNIATLIIPYDNAQEYFTAQDIQRGLLENIPMLVISVILFAIFMKRGLSLYRSLPPSSSKERDSDPI